MSEKKFIPFNELDEKERKRLQSLGGKKSGETRARKKTMKQLLEMVLDLPADENIKKTILKLGISKDEKITNNLALQIVALREGLKGNMKAYEVIRDSIGQKPTENMNINSNNVVYDVSKMSDEKIEELLKKADGDIE